MQNNHMELWNIVDLVVKGHLGNDKEFEDHFAHPIRMGR
jgi:SNF2 family DNA or RNA helicase